MNRGFCLKSFTDGLGFGKKTKRPSKIAMVVGFFFSPPEQLVSLAHGRTRTRERQSKNNNGYVPLPFFL